MSHTSISELITSIKKAQQQVVVGGTYYHYRSPDKHYQVVNLAIDEATDKVVVIYKPLYLEAELLWTRSLDIWCENVEGVPRFTKVS